MSSLAEASVTLEMSVPVACMYWEMASLVGARKVPPVEFSWPRTEGNRVAIALRVESSRRPAMASVTVIASERRGEAVMTTATWLKMRTMVRGEGSAEGLVGGGKTEFRTVFVEASFMYP
jgi:hypothetical protein